MSIVRLQRGYRSLMICLVLPGVLPHRTLIFFFSVIEILDYFSIGSFVHIDLLYGFLQMSYNGIQILSFFTFLCVQRSKHVFLCPSLFLDYVSVWKPHLPLYHLFYSSLLKVSSFPLLSDSLLKNVSIKNISRLKKSYQEEHIKTENLYTITKYVNFTLYNYSLSHLPLGFLGLCSLD